MANNTITYPTKSTGSPMYAADANQIKNAVNANFEILNGDGSNIRNFIKKARDYRAGRNLANAPKVVIFGDSITGGSWATLFKQYLFDNYNIPLDNIEIMWFGGYSIYAMTPSIDSNLIHPNWDLIIFNENEYFNSVARFPDQYLMRIEQVIQKIRKHTTSDIMIGTWSLRGSVAQDLYDGVITYDDLISDVEYEAFNWYRDVAIKYNCEVVDFNQALVNYILEGNNPSGHYDTVHWDTTWYNDVFYPELVRHIRASDYQSKLNIPYPLGYKEELIYLAENVNWSTFKNDKLTLSSGWTTVDKEWEFIRNTNIGDTVIIDAKNIIGFEITNLISATSKNYTIEINDGTGYVAPSLMTPFGKLMEYSTDIVSATYPSQADWTRKRIKMIAEPTVSIGDENTTPEKYTLTVTAVTLTGSVQNVTFNVKDSVGTIIGSGYTTTDQIVLPEITIPTYFNGNDNFRVVDADVDFPAFSVNNVVVGDEYEFYIKSNWIDTVDTNTYAYAYVFGLEPADYTIKLTMNAADMDLVTVKLLHS